MTVEEAIMLCREWVGRPHASLSATDKRQIASLYTEVLGKHIRACNCKNKYDDAVAEIYHFLKKEGKMKEQSRYILKSGVVIQPKGSSKVYTNDNLTDEVAQAFLLERPNAVGLFVYIPTEEKTTKKKRNK